MSKQAVTQHPLPDFTFQPLTYIRQIGTHTSPGGAVTYTFLAQASKHLPLVVVTLTVTTTHGVIAHACFDPNRKESELHAD
jgi:hypothetical protein